MDKPAESPEARALAKAEVNRIATLLLDTWKRVDPSSRVAHFPTSYVANFADMARAIVADLAAITARPTERGVVERLREALEPVMHWYQSDEHEPRPLSEIVADIVADLQADRGAALKLAALATQTATGRTMGGEAPSEDWLTEVLDDSLDMDWTGRVGAQAIIREWDRRSVD